MNGAKTRAARVGDGRNPRRTARSPGSQRQPRRGLHTGSL